MKVYYNNINAQYKRLKSEIDRAVISTLESSEFFLGENTKSFERELSDYLGVYSILCSSGTSSLINALLALDVEIGDEVITSDFSFRGVIQAITLLGLRAVFVDIREDNFCIDTSKLQSKITGRTKAIIPVSIFGNVSDMDIINDLADSYSIPVIEDGAQGFGSRYKGNLSGSLSDMAITSFYPSKTLGAYGNAGAIFTKSRELYERCISIRDLSSDRGINSRVDEIQASILRVKFKYLEEGLGLKYSLAKRYNEELKGIDNRLILPIIGEGTSVYSLRHPNRDAILEVLSKENVAYKVYYDTPLHRYNNISDRDYPVSCAVSGDIFSLPLYPYLEEQDRIISVMKKALGVARLL